MHAPLVLVIEHSERFCVPNLGQFNGLGFARFGALLLSWLGQVAFFRPHSMGCGLSSLCCIICRALPHLWRAAGVPEYQRFSPDLRMASPAPAPLEICPESLYIRTFEHVHPS